MELLQSCTKPSICFHLEGVLWPPWRIIHALIVSPLCYRQGQPTDLGLKPCTCWSVHSRVTCSQGMFQYKDRLSMYRDFHYKDKTVVRPGIGISIIKIRWLWDYLIFVIMRITILVRWHLYIEMAPLSYRSRVSRSPWGPGTIILCTADALALPCLAKVPLLLGPCFNVKTVFPGKAFPLYR